MHDANVVAGDEREWIDWRWGWLIERLGVERVRNAPVFTGPEHFVTTRRPLTPEGMETLAERIASEMGLGTQGIIIVTSTGETVDEQNDYQERFEQAMQEPGALVAGVGAEEYVAPQRAAIGLVRSLTASYLGRMGWLDGLGPGTRVAGELAAVMLGAGVILANNAFITQNTSDGAVSYFRTERLSDLSQPGLAYAVARFAYLRGGSDIGWLKHLRADPRAACKQVLAGFQAAPPLECAPKPGWVLDTWEEVEAAAEAEAEQQEGWTEEDLLPANLHEVVSDSTRIYCVVCAHELTNLPAGQCPACSGRFDPEDLRTVTTIKPKPISKEKRLAIDKRNHLIKQLIKRGLYVLGALMVIGLVVECANR
ncbi:MAG: hypothetical protein AAGI37_06470 [Planctomycetota bacterium]